MNWLPLSASYFAGTISWATCCEHYPALRHASTRTDIDDPRYGGWTEMVRDGVDKDGLFDVLQRGLL